MNGNIEFDIALLKQHDRWITRLYGMNALIDTGASYLLIGMSDTVIKNLFEATCTNRCINILGISKNEILDPGMIYNLRSFHLGPLSYMNIPAIGKDIADKQVDIIIGMCMFGPGTKLTYDKDQHSIHIFVPESTALQHSAWGTNPVTGERFLLTPETVQESYVLSVS